MTTLFTIILSFIVLSVGSNLQQSRNFAKDREWKLATEYALSALEEANDSKDNIARAEALIQLSTIDIMTWRDEQAWEHASQAEMLAKAEKNDTLAADALLNKGKICLYANVTGAESGEIKGLGFFNEALELSKDSPRRQVAIYYEISQVYIGLNRLKDPIDSVLYSQAGEAIETGERIAAEYGFKDLLTKALTYKVRYYRQGGRIKEAIDCCMQTFALSEEDDYLARSQIYSQLVPLYALEGKTEESVAAHQNYANTMQKYINQRSDTLLQEMETRYQAVEKENRILLLRSMVYVLFFFVAVLVAFTIILFRLNKKLKKQKQSLDIANSGKEELLKLVSKEFTNPSYNKQVHQSVQRMRNMDEKGIRDYCASLFGSAESDLGNELGEFFVNLIENRRKVADKFGLTSRELDIIRCCREGMSNAQIADNLSISLSTVKNHKQNIFSKMNVRSVTEMLSVSMESGLM